MTIHRSSYSRYDGPLESPRTRFVAIAEFELRRLIKQKWVRRVLLLAWTPTVFLIGFLYVGLVLKRATGMDAVGGDVYVSLFNTEQWFVAIAMAAFGSSMIARDIQSRALCLYFTRPLDVDQYLWGKLAAIGSTVLAITFLPGLVLAIAQLVMSQPLDLLQFADVLWRLIVASGLTAMVAGLIILLLSSLGTRTTYIGLAWLGIFVILEMLRGVLTQRLGTHPGFDLVSVAGMLRGMVRLLFARDSERLPALVGFIGLGLFCFIALRMRLQSLEKRAT